MFGHVCCDPAMTKPSDHMLDPDQRLRRSLQHKTDIALMARRTVGHAGHSQNR